MAFTTLEATIFKIAGQAFGPGSTIGSGIALRKVQLTTIDQDSGPIGPLQLVFDPVTLNQGERASFRINGQEVATTVPDLFLTSLQTNAGTIRALTFTVGNDTYVLPTRGADLAAITRTVASSDVNISGGSLIPAEYGLVPENANTYSGMLYTEEFSGQFYIANSLRQASILDADGVRGNADSAGEEVFNSGAPAFSGASSAEVLATIQFKDGTIAGAVKAVVSYGYGGYVSTSTYAFDDAALAAAGKTIGDIARVIGTSAFDHNLNWQDLGFDLSAVSDGGAFTPDPLPMPEFNRITGDNRANKLNGTAERDVIYGLGGNDTMDGRGGNDAFVFGSETRNGRRETDVIRNYEAGDDGVYFDVGAQVRSVVNIQGGVRITFAGDGDRVEVFGVGVDRFTVGLFSAEFLV